jgi:hypothetical protein
MWQSSSAWKRQPQTKIVLTTLREDSIWEMYCLSVLDLLSFCAMSRSVLDYNF